VCVWNRYYPDFWGVSSFEIRSRTARRNLGMCKSGQNGVTSELHAQR